MLFYLNKIYSLLTHEIFVLKQNKKDNKVIRQTSWYFLKLFDQIFLIVNISSMNTSKIRKKLNEV